MIVGALEMGLSGTREDTLRAEPRVDDVVDVELPVEGRPNESWREGGEGTGWFGA